MDARKSICREDARLALGEVRHEFVPQLLIKRVLVDAVFTRVIGVGIYECSEGIPEELRGVFQILVSEGWRGLINL